MKDSTLDSAPAQRPSEQENFSNRKLIRPSLSRNEQHAMGRACVDECVRQLILTGANPDKLAILDNYCMQASAHLTGTVRSHELAAIGRRVCENEHDLLLLLG